MNWRIVQATRGKRTRAAAAALLYEQARVHHVGTARVFAELKERLTLSLLQEGERQAAITLVWMSVTTLRAEVNAPCCQAMTWLSQSPAK